MGAKDWMWDRREKPRKKRARPSRSLLFQELEPRVLYSADPILAAAALAEEPAPLELIVARDDAYDQSVEDLNTPERQAPPAREIVFVDTDTENYAQLVDDLIRGGDKNREFDVILLDNVRDGIDQISEVLAGYDSLDAMHIVSHGQSGAIDLGATRFDLGELNDRLDEVSNWAGAFTANGDLLVYGCDLAAGNDGRAFVSALANATQTDVAASSDLTGTLLLGGDWDLEFRLGGVETNVAFSATLQSSYESVFANYAVTSLADNGAGTLRQALIDAEANGGADTISFDIAGTIALTSALPDIDHTVTIDASTAPGYVNQPVVILDGTSAGATNGLFLTTGSDGSEVRGLRIIEFGGNGIEINGSNNNTIVGNYIGTDGSVDQGNSASGIEIFNSSGNVIGGTGTNDGNYIAFNSNRGIDLSGSGSGNEITGNTLTQNVASAIHSFIDSTTIFGNTIYNNSTGFDFDEVAIGDEHAVYHNVIYGAQDDGISVEGSNAVIKNNIIVGNTDYGIRLFSGSIAEASYNLITDSSTPPSNGLGQASFALDSTNINADPLFANAGTGDFSVLTGSPAINAGSDLGAFQRDRTPSAAGLYEGSAPDIGAFEFSPSTAADITSNLGAHWTFDTNANDSSGFNRHGTLSGTATIDNTALTNKVGSGKLHLDGSGDYVDLNAHLATFAAMNQGTIAAWVNLTASGENTIFGISDQGEGTELAKFSIENGSLKWLNINDSGGYIIANSDALISDGAWHHVAVTVNASGTTLFIDGEEAATTFSGGDALESSFFDDITDADRVDIGRSVRSSAVESEYNGLLDEVRLYSRALSVTDIAALAAEAPIANHDSATTIVDTPITINVTSNDSDLDSEAIVVLDVSNPTNGTVVNNEDGSITYTPNSSYVGADNFQYLASDVEDITSYWRLDSDSIATDVVGSNNGTVTGASIVPGVFGNGLSFNGSTDHVSINNFALNQDFSVSFKFKVDDSSGSAFQYLYSHGDIDFAHNLNVFLGEAGSAAPNLLRTAIMDGDDGLSNTALEFDISAIIGDGDWHTYTLTVASGEGSKVYLDGELKNADSSRGGGAFNPAGNLILGGKHDLDNTRAFGGSLDSVMISNRALGAADVQDIHTGARSLGTVNVSVAAELSPTSLVATAIGQGGLSLNADGGNDAYFLADSGFTSPLDRFTFELRFAANSTPGETVFVSYNTASGDVLSVQINNPGNQLELDFGGLSTVNSNAIDYTAALLDGQAHTLSTTWDNASGAWQIYIDGTLIDSGTGLSTGATVAAGGSLVFGQEQDSIGGSFESTQYFSGTLYGARFYDDIRSANEISVYQHDAVPLDEAGLIASWNFDNLSPNGVVTESVTANNLQLMHVSGSGFTASTPRLAVEVDERSSNGAQVAMVYGSDAEREARISNLLAADSDLVYSAETDSFYKRIDAEIDWPTASANAAATALSGVTGELATARSATEHTVLAELAANAGFALWLGASDATTEGEWYWYADGVAEEQFWQGDETGYNVANAYTNWLVGRPDNSGGTQHYLALRADGFWNDVDVNEPSVDGYIVQWNADEVLDATDPLAYTIESQSVANTFSIDSDSGEIVVNDNAGLNFDTATSHTVTVRVTDSNSGFTEQTFTFAVTDANRPALVSLPANQTTPEDTPLTFSTGNGNLISISDDASDSSVVSVSVTNGTLNANASGTADISDNGSSTIILSGTLAEINAALDGLEYRPNANSTAGDTLTVSVFDDAVYALNIDSKLSGHYTFDSAAPANDNSPIGLNNGSFVGDASIVSDPIRGDVLSLDGNRDYVEVSSLFDSPASVTVAAWVNFEATDDFGGEVISLGNAVVLRADDVSNGVNGFFYDGSSFNFINSNVNIGDGQWHHLALTIDDDANTQTLYIDGEVVASASFAQSINYATGFTNTRIGAHPNDGDANFDFNGLIDGTRVYSRALTSTEINALVEPNISSDSDSLAITVSAENDAPTFSAGDGIVVNSLATQSDGATDVVVQADDKFIVLSAVNTAGTGQDIDFALTRYNADGSLDPSFGTGGTVITALNANDESANAISLQADGKILVAGSYIPGATSDSVVMRYNANGTLDTTFDTDGIATFAVTGSTDEQITDMTVQPDGKIVVIGYATIGGTEDIFLARLNANGSLDTSFDSDGIASFAAGVGDDRGEALAIQSDGKIVGVGSSVIGADYDVTVIRLNTDGSLDTSFSGDGIRTRDINSTDEFGRALAIDSSGRIVVGGKTINGSGDSFVLRFNADGSDDATFGSGGEIKVSTGTVEDVYDIAIQPDGKVVVVGSAFNGSDNDVSLFRLDDDGSLDASFGTGGTLTTDFNGNADAGIGIALTPSGEIIVVGETTNTNGDSFVATYNSDGSLNKQFNLINTLDGNPTFVEGGAAVILDADVVIYDEELSELDDFEGTSLQFVRNGGNNADDVFSAIGNLEFNGGNLELSTIDIGSYLQLNGLLVLNFGAGATNAQVNEAMQSIAYENTSNSPPASVQIDWTFNDGGDSVNTQGGAAETASGSTIVNIQSAADLAITAPTTHSTNEDTQLVFSGGNVVQIDDGLAGDNLVAVSLSVANGTLSLATTTGIAFAEGANGAAAMVIQGLESALNTALDGLMFDPDNDYNGADTLDITLAVAADLLGHYTFEGDVSDQSAGPTQDGTINGDVVIVTDVDRGQVLSLDGTGDYVEINGVFGNPADVTLAAWINVNAGSFADEVISLGDNVVLRSTDTDDGLRFIIRGTSSWQVVNSGINVSGQGWTHVAATIDDTSGAIAIYINGELVATDTATESIQYNLGANTRIGENGNGLSHPFFGLIDDARIYTRALDAEEIATLATDQASVSHAVAITVTAADDTPTVTLGSAIAVEFTEQNPVGVDVGIVVADVDSANLVSATVAITGGYEMGVDSLNFTPSGGISGSFSAASGILTLSGNASVADYQTLLRTVSFVNSSDTPSTAQRTIGWVVDDGNSTSTPVTRNVNVTALNDAPVNTAPAAPTTNEDTNLSFTGADQIQISDVDASGADVRVQLNLGGGGLLNFGDSTGLSFTAGDGVNDANMVFTGSVSAINTALLTLTFTPTADSNGSTNLTIITNDQGNTGSDPGTSGDAVSEQDTDIVTITVNAVNDEPALTAGTVADLVVNEDSGLTSLGLSGLTYGPGGGSDENTQTLGYEVTVIPDSVAFGKIFLADGTTQVSTGTYSLSQLQGMQFRPEPNVNGGPSFFTYRVVDSGGTANGGTDTNTETIQIDITAQNDPSVITGTFTGDVDEGNVGDAPETATGAIAISDPDAGDNPFFADVASTAGDNAYGSFVLSSGTWTYTLDQSAVQDLDAGDMVTDTITYTASDSSTQQITVTITGADDDPVITGTVAGAVNEGNVGDAPVTATGAISISDVDDDDSPSFADVASTVGDNAYGSFVLSSGNWTYTLDQSAVQDLDAGDMVIDTITYTASDSSTQQITVTITGRDDASVITGTVAGAVNEGDVGDAPVTATGTISISDADANDSPIIADVASTVGDNSYGSFVLSSGTWTYTLDQSAVQDLDAGDMVSDTITYTASDSSTQQITVTITGTNDASVISGTVGGAVNEGNVGDAPVTATGAISISDVDGDDNPTIADVASTVGDNAYGSFVLSSGTWTYTLDQSVVQDLDAGDMVTDTITYTASDSSTQLVTVTITGTDDASAITGTVAGAVNEGDVGDAPVTATGAISISDVDADDNPSIADVGSTVGDNAYGSFVLSAGTWTYTLDQSTVQDLDTGDMVTDTITYTASDSSTQQITVTITGTDDASVITGTVAAAVNEGNVGDAPVTATGAISISDVDGDDNPTIADVGSTVGDNAYGSFVLSSGTWTYTLDQSAVQDLDAGDMVTDTITYTASDSSTQQITVTITGTDDASVISGTVAGAVNEGNVGDAPVTATGAISIADADDDDSPSIADVGSTAGDNAYGSFVLTSGTWTYTLDQSTVQDLDAGDMVSDTITYTASDSSTQQITVTITGTADASVISGTVIGAVNEGNIGDAPVTATGAISITDVDADDSPSIADVGSTAGDNAYGSFVMSGGTWTYTLDQSAVQDLDAGDMVTDTITYTASDSSTQQITVTITGTDDASVISGTVAGAVNEGNVGDAPVTATGAISIADADDDDSPTIADVGSTAGDNAYGSFVLSSGTWTYTLDQSTVQELDAGDMVTDTITYTASDSSTQQITITITGTDDASVIAGTVAGAVNEGNVGDAPVTATGAISITDVDDDDSPTITDVASTVGDNAFGSFVLTSGTWTYTLDQSAVQDLDAGDMVTDSITYTASDSSTQQITVTITGTDDASIITGTIAGAVNEGNIGDAPVTATGAISIADLDDDDSPTIADVGSTVGDNAYGSFVLSSGTWTYTLDQSAVQDLDAGDMATDTITYTASDSSTQQITVTITGTEDASVISGTVTAAVNEGDVGDAPVTATGAISISDVDGDDNPTIADVGSTVGDNAYGSFVLSAGTWTYTLDQSAVQDLDVGDIVSDTITYTASDSSTQLITVTITGTDDVSVITGTVAGAVNEGNVGDAPVTATGAISVSDVDADDNPSIADAASTLGDNGYGSFVLSSGTWTYTLDQSAVQDLDAGDMVSDTITYTASDASTQQITVTITGANDAAVIAGTVIGAVSEGNVGDAPVTATGIITISDVDNDDNPTIADVASTVGDDAYGSFVLSSGTWTYTLDQSAVQDLDAGDMVSDTITYTASDSSTQQITVTITGTDDSSVITGTVAGAVNEGNVGDAPVTATGAISIADVDDDDSPTFADVASTAGDNAYGNFVLNSGNWTYTLDQSAVQDLDAGDIVTDTITFTASDASSQLISVTITGTNDNAVITGTVVGAINEGNLGDAPATVSAAIAITDLDQDDSPFFADVASTLGDNAYGSFELNAGTWTYTLNQTTVQNLDAGDVVTDSITFTASESSTQQITVTITGTDDDPVVAGTTTGNVIEGNAGDAPVTTSGILTITDVDDDDNPTFADVASTLGDNAYGRFSLASGTWNYTLNQSAVQHLDVGESVNDRFTFVSSNGFNQNIVVAIAGAADAPVSLGVTNVSVLEDATPSLVDLVGSFFDPEDTASELNYMVSSPVGDAIVSSVAINGGNLELRYSPDAFGSAVLNVIATDTQGASVQTSFNIDVLAVDDAPEIVTSIGAFLTEGESLSVSNAHLKAIDIDSLQSAIVYTLEGEVRGGELRLNNNPLGAGASFTQADIDAERLSYLANDAEQAFGFAYRIGNPLGSSSAAQVFNIAVSAAESSDDEGVDGAGTIDELNGTPDTSPEMEEPLPRPGELPGELIEPSKPSSVQNTNSQPAPLAFDLVNALIDDSQAQADAPFAREFGARAADDTQGRDRDQGKPVRTVVPILFPEPDSETVEAGRTELSERERSDRVQSALRNALDTLESDLDSALQDETSQAQIVMAAGHIGGATMSAGVLAWLFRAGSLMASVLSVMPLWARMDPLPVLLKDKDEADLEELDEDEKAAALILQGGREHA